MAEQITKFNTNLIKLLKELEKYYPDSGEIITLNNRIKILKNELGREMLIEKCGPEIYVYKEKIYAREMDFFRNFNNIKKMSNIDDSKKNYNLVITIFRMASEIYPKLPKANQDEMYDRLLILLDSYIKYKKL